MKFPINNNVQCATLFTFVVRVCNASLVPRTRISAGGYIVGPVAGQEEYL